MFDFLEEVENLADKARGLIAEGSHDKAKRVIKRLRNSMYSEGWTYAAELSARIELLEGDAAKARETALEGLNDSWGNQELLDIIRAGNPVTSVKTKLFEITIKAGGPAHGPVGMFDSEHVVTFIVLAEDEFEGMKYICEVARFRADYTPPVVEIKMARPRLKEKFPKGVYAITPFSHSAAQS